MFKNVPNIAFNMLTAHLTLKQGSKVKFDTAKELQDIISYWLFSHFKVLRPLIKEIQVIYSTVSFSNSYCSAVQ